MSDGHGGADVSTLLQAWGKRPISRATRPAHVPSCTTNFTGGRRRTSGASAPGTLFSRRHSSTRRYLRLNAQDRAAMEKPRAVLRGSRQMMRRILVDHARGHQMLKRVRGQWTRVTLIDVPANQPDEVDLLDLRPCAERAGRVRPRKHQIAELRFFGGLSLAEAGRALDISMATAERDWQAARAWLYARLTHGRRHDA